MTEKRVLIIESKNETVDLIDLLSVPLCKIFKFELITLLFVAEIRYLEEGNGYWRKVILPA